MTHKEIILKCLTKQPMTCKEICDAIITRRKLNKQSNIARYLSGSISSKLAKLVKENVLEYDPTQTGQNGGHVYRLIS